ncbi:GAF domain-like protein [Calocera cornea HHB12733]|uniref:GAF domain-like protein n=1 Tax=Calocera cornea HHB12733 TaxID=1353952 RepID=A0A165FYJ4_9BASI|nr:GAF domain-like protein [Calocera cornea HHB12733]
MVEASRLPSGISSKKEFYDLICEQLAALLEGERSWITNLSNASSLLFWAFRDSHFWGDGEGAVNWCGFYLDSSFFPSTSASPSPSPVSPPGSPSTAAPTPILKLGPFQGRPACLLIPARAGGGVCADAYVRRRPVLVADVHQYAGHIPCDAETSAEVVLPLVVPSAGRAGGGGEGRGRALGVLDLDCLRVGGFDEQDVRGLGSVAEIVVRACDWPEAP